MAVTAEVLGTRLSMKFTDGDKTVSKSYGNVKESAADEKIFNTATQIAGLTDNPVEQVKKIVETELSNA
jgi:hypothetical protein